MNALQAVKEAVRSVQTDNRDATEPDVLHAAKTQHDLRPADVKHAYDDLRARGEIYSYESEGSVVVKVTDDVVA